MIESAVHSQHAIVQFPESLDQRRLDTDGMIALLGDWLRTYTIASLRIKEALGKDAVFAGWPALAFAPRQAGAAGE